jgi:hypothetical protein
VESEDKGSSTKGHIAAHSHCLLPGYLQGWDWDTLSGLCVCFF